MKKEKQGMVTDHGGMAGNHRRIGRTTARGSARAARLMSVIHL